MAYRHTRLAAAAFVVMFPAAPCIAAQAPAPVPASVGALAGCWRGTGEAVGKHVQIAITANDILDRAMFVVDVLSSTIGNSNDRYAAHLVFGGAGQTPEGAAGDVTGFWSDTFGGAYAVMGRGRSLRDGFDVSYAYPDATFVNRWRVADGRLTWDIVERDRNGSQKRFATYALTRASCGAPDMAK